MRKLNTGSDAPKTQFVKTIYILAKCRECNINYAAFHDPQFPIQIYFFDRDSSLEVATHVVSGEFLCLNGHGLEMVAQQAVYTDTGKWIMLKPIGLHTLDL